jgi:hypothetical protein
MTWHAAIWDSESPAGNTPPDADDDGRTNDYANSPGGHPDGSLANYCHELEEGGHADWRVPTLDELFSVTDFGNGAAVHFAINTDRNYHSSNTVYTSSDACYHVNISSGAHDSGKKGDKLRIVCVRKGT